MIDLSFKDLAIGEQVKTKKGFIWKYLGEGKWLDETSMVTWLPAAPGRYNYKEAMALEDEKKRLPIKGEFEVAKNHGIREIFDMTDKRYWSSSVCPGNLDYVYFFNANDGNFYFEDRDDNNEFVHCVERTK